MPTAQDLVEALLKADRITNDINPGEPGKPGYNPQMTIAWALRYATHATLAYRGVEAARREIAELSKAVKQLADRPAPGQPPEIDYDQLAAALLRRIAQAGNS